MRRTLTLISTLWAASLLASPAPAAPPQGESAGGTAVEAPAPEATAPAVDAEALALSRQMAAELDELLVANRAAIEAIEARLAEAPLDQHEALQQQIVAIKDAEALQQLEVQARYARLMGHEARALELEAVLEARRNPAPVAAPADVRVDRPVPGTESN